MTERDDTPLHELLRAARISAGLRQAQIAVLAGTSTSYVCQYENGRMQPTWGTLHRLVTAYGFELVLVPLTPEVP